MPMPKPHMDEDHDEWMDRCMSDDMMMEEFEDGEQRAAVCQTAWEDRDKGHTSMGFKRMVVPMEVKEVTDKGVFSGYASVFGNVDLGGDVISKDEPFKEFARTRDGKVLTLFQHDSFGMTPSGGLPIGLAEIEQNSKGLKFTTELVMDDPFVQRVHKHLKAGTLRGMSIGYDVLPGGAKILESGVRELTALKLWEISVVTFPMNPKAAVDAVKTATAPCRSVRELELLLRDAVGISRAQAKLHAGAIWKTLTGQREADGEVAETVQRMTDFLKTV